MKSKNILTEASLLAIQQALIETNHSPLPLNALVVQAGLHLSPAITPIEIRHSVLEAVQLGMQNGFIEAVTRGYVITPNGRANFQAKLTRGTFKECEFLGAALRRKASLVQIAPMSASPEDAFLFGVLHGFMRAAYTPFPMNAFTQSLNLIFGGNQVSLPTHAHMRKGIKDALQRAKSRQLIVGTVGRGFEITKQGREFYFSELQSGRCRNSGLLTVSLQKFIADSSAE